MIRITKFSATIFFIIVILAMLFLLFVFPLLFDEYKEISFFAIIILLSIIILCIEGLVKLFFGRYMRNRNELRFFYKTRI